MILHPYQRRARLAAKALYAEGARSILYVAPTGAGKTVILADTILSHLKHHANPRVTVYAHRRELCSQAAKTFRAFGIDVGAAGENLNAPVQVRSTQAALARGEVDRSTLVCFDECHHYAADEWGGLVDVHKASGATIVGATATPERGDGKPLAHMFEKLVVVAQVKELVEWWRGNPGQGLVPYEIKVAARVMRTGQLAISPRAAYEKFARGRRAVVFAPHVKAAKEYADGWLGARVVHGAMPVAEREAALEGFRRHGGVLVNVNVLTEGWDCPSCDCVIIARPMGSVGMMIQACGRGARPDDGNGKKDCLIVDLVGVTRRECLGRPDDDRIFSLDGEVGISREGASLAEERLCKICQAVIEDGAEHCPNGHFNGLVVPVGVGVEVEAWNERYTGDDDEKRVDRLAKWLRVMMIQGKTGKALFSAKYKFAATYKKQPDRSTWDLAMARARRAS